MAKRNTSATGSLYLNARPSDEELNPFAVPIGTYAERATGRKTTAKQKGDKPRNVGPRIRKQASVSAPRQGYARRAEEALSRAIPALEPVVSAGESLFGAAELEDALTRGVTSLFDRNAYAGTDGLRNEDAALLGITGLAGPAFSLAGKGAKKAFSVLPAGVREGVSDLGVKGMQWARENAPLFSRGASAPLRDADFVEGLYRQMPEEISFAARPQQGRIGTTYREPMALPAAEERLGLPAPGRAAQKGFSVRDIRPSTDDVFSVMRANTTAGRVVGDRMRPISELTGGVSQAADDQLRVKKLAEAMSSPEGYVSRLVVDDAGNVIEGQHRLEALRALGVTEVPVTEYQDFGRDLSLPSLSQAASAAQEIHPDQANQIAANLAEIYADEGGDLAEIMQYEAPAGFEKAWEAARDALIGSTQPKSPAASFAVPALPAAEERLGLPAPGPGLPEWAAKPRGGQFYPDTQLGPIDAQAAGEGTRNYVMFSDEPISIRRKYRKGGRAKKAPSMKVKK